MYEYIYTVELFMLLYKLRQYIFVLSKKTSTTASACIHHYDNSYS